MDTNLGWLSDAALAALALAGGAGTVLVGLALGWPWWRQTWQMVTMLEYYLVDDGQGS